MTIGEFCNRDVVIVEKTESIQQVIELMRSHHVGDVVVEILAEDVDLDAINVGDVMSDELATVNEETELIYAIELLRDKGVRRAPVTDEDGCLVGILTVDDILPLVAEQLVAITSLIAKEQIKERKQRN